MRPKPRASGWRCASRCWSGVSYRFRLRPGRRLLAALFACAAAAAAFLKDTGVTASLTVKSASEALAQITAERASPKHDVWFGGGGHLRAAQLALTDEYRSPALEELHDWAVRIAEASAWHAV